MQVEVSLLTSCNRDLLNKLISGCVCIACDNKSDFNRLGIVYISSTADGIN